MRFSPPDSDSLFELSVGDGRHRPLQRRRAARRPLSYSQRDESYEISSPFFPPFSFLRPPFFFFFSWATRARRAPLAMWVLCLLPPLVVARVEEIPFFFFFLPGCNSSAVSFFRRRIIEASLRRLPALAASGFFFSSPSTSTVHTVSFPPPSRYTRPDAPAPFLRSSVSPPLPSLSRRCTSRFSPRRTRSSLPPFSTSATKSLLPPPPSAETTFLPAARRTLFRVESSSPLSLCDTVLFFFRPRRHRVRRVFFLPRGSSPFCLRRRWFSCPSSRRPFPIELLFHARLHWR